MAKKKSPKAKEPRKPKTKSRIFEELITRIEKALLPGEATVKSPDRILDKVTGIMREVDASIYYQYGSVSDLMTIECRDRKKVDDVTWIEQLVTKQKDIGAARTIAVSAKGFSGPAIKKAAFHGIETRQIQDITEDEIKEWNSKFEITTFQVDIQFTKALAAFNPPMALEMSETIAEAMAKDQNNTPFIFCKA